MEVAVLGAGLAGLEAARVLAERGIEVEVFEATMRVGGRVRTEHHDDILPVELGPEFMHGEPRVLTSLVRGAPVTLDKLTNAYLVQRDGELVDGGDLWQRVSRSLAGARDRVDRSARSYVDHAGLDPDEAHALAMFVEGFYGAPLDDISITNVVEDAGGVGQGDERTQQRVHGGYGGIVEWLADRVAEAGVIVHHGCVVHRVSWSHASARVDYRSVAGDRSIGARRVVIALPLGVLQNTGPTGVEFVPGLVGHRAAIVHLGMGQVVKLVACLREPLWDDHAELTFVQGRSGCAFPTYWMRSRGGRHQLTAWAGGEHAEALAGLGPEELAERALDGFADVARVSPSRIASALLHYHFHDYQADPWSRGAYSYVRVGERHAPHELARPLAGTLFFAGEATNANYEGTVVGALGSGNRAANQITRSLRAI